MKMLRNALIISLLLAPAVCLAGKGNTTTRNWLGVKDSGKTMVVPAGKKVHVRLPANPSTGYKWQVTSASRTLGYPQEKYIPSQPGAVGSPGTTRLSWSTSNPVLSTVGTHHFELAYSRGGSEPAAKTFSFDVEVK